MIKKQAARKKKSGSSKILSLPEAARVAVRARQNGKRVVTTNGCFDILHLGHLRSFERAKALGDLLIVGVNSDESVRGFKGPLRPIVPEAERAELVAGLKPVDVVFIFSDPDPRPWLEVIRPHVHVKGADRKMSEIVERGVVRRHGGQVVRLPLEKGRSTTNVIKKILDSHK